MGNGGNKDRIIADYLGGMTAPEVARKYGRSLQGLYVSLWRWGVRLPKGERDRRSIATLRRTQAVRSFRRRVWPDCPAHLREDYATLRKYMTAREAREVLEAKA